MRKILSVLLLCSAIPFIAGAQTLSNKDKRKMNMLIYEAISNYERYSSLYDINARYGFIDLFESPSTVIYCDLLDRMSTYQEVPVETYVDMLSQMQLVNTEIKRVNRGETVYRDNLWHTEVVCNKTISYLDKNGVWFSSTEYFGQEFLISFDFVYDPVIERCYIAGIKGHMFSEVRPLPNKFWVMQPTKKKNNWLTKTERVSLQDNSVISTYEPVKFNEFNQAFIGYRAKNLVNKNDNVHIKARRTRKKHIVASSDNYDLVNIQYGTSNWRLKFRYAMAYDGLFKVSSPVDFSSQKSTAVEYGADLGITFPLGRSTQFGLYGGAALQTSDILFEKSGISYNYVVNNYIPASSSFNSDDYPVPGLRKYNITAREVVKYQDIVIPVYFAFDHNFGKAVAFTWNLGAKFYINSTISESTYNISGQVNDQSYDKNFSEFLFPSSYTPEQQISLTGGAGFNINLIRRTVFLMLKANYEYSLGNVHTSNENQFMTNSSYPVIYSEKTGNDMATRSFMDCVSYRREGLWIEGGLMFKF